MIGFVSLHNHKLGDVLSTPGSAHTFRLCRTRRIPACCVRRQPRAWWLLGTPPERPSRSSRTPRPSRSSSSSSSSSKAPGRPPEAAEPPATRRELINRVLASQRASLIVVVASVFLYGIGLLLLARRASLPFLPSHERVLLLGLGLLLPDFRYSVARYLDAVRVLARYRLPEGASARARVFAESLPPAVRDVLPIADIRARLSELDAYVSTVTKEHFLTRVGNDLMGLVGTDLTLRKRVLVEAGTIVLSLLGCFIAALVDGGAAAGGATCMVAALMPSAMSARTQHELIALLHDARAAVAMFGTLAAVAVALKPLVAAYVFLVFCMALVALRVPQYGV